METSPSPKPSRSIPLIYEGDSYFIYCTELDPSTVKLDYVERFPGNISTSPTKENFYDLDPATRRAVISQVNRRYQGKVVKV